MPEVRDVAGAVDLREHLEGPLADHLRARVEGAGIEVPLDPTLGRISDATRPRRIGVPVDAEDITPGGLGDLAEGPPRTGGEADDGDAGGLGDRRGTRHVREGELPIFARPERARPGVEELERLRAGRGLRDEEAPDVVGEPLHQRVREGGVGEEELLGDAERLGPLPLGHVGEEGPRRAGEADEGDAAMQLAPCHAQRVTVEAEPLLGFHIMQTLEVLHRPHWIGELRTDPLVHRQRHPHRRRDHEDIGEDDRGIDPHEIDGLERHLGGELRRMTHGEEVRRGADRPILGEIATRLAHHPDGRTLDRFTAAGTKEEIVHGSGHQRFREVRGRRRAPGVTRGGSGGMGGPAKSDSSVTLKACSASPWAIAVRSLVIGRARSLATMRSVA